MATVRYLVRDVDDALPFYEALGFTITQRWGPPFVMLAREDLTLWLSGPGSSASRPLPTGPFPSPEAGTVGDRSQDLEASWRCASRGRDSVASRSRVPAGGKCSSRPLRHPIELFEAAGVRPPRQHPGSGMIDPAQAAVGPARSAWASDEWRSHERRRGCPTAGRRLHLSRSDRFVSSSASE